VPRELAILDEQNQLPDSLCTQARASHVLAVPQCGQISPDFNTVPVLGTVAGFAPYLHASSTDTMPAASDETARDVFREKSSLLGKVTNVTFPKREGAILQ
jgi:hypothetical protein